MDLQKIMLSEGGNFSFKENSRVGKETKASPTLGELQNGGDISDSTFAGLGTNVWIVPKKEALASFTKGVGLCKGNSDDGENLIGFDEIFKNGVCLTASDNSYGDGSNTEHVNPLSLDNPFVRGYSANVIFDCEDHLRSACKLTKCILPYGSNIPFIERYIYPLGKDILSFEMKKPWRFYHLPHLEILIATFLDEIMGVIFVVDSEVIGNMTREDYFNHLTYKK